MIPGQFDPPLSLFGGEGAIPEFSRNQRLLTIERRFRASAMACAGSPGVAGATRHIADGVIPRHLMMCTSRTFIYQNTRGVEGGLSPLLAAELDVHLNGFYLNLAGGLDNLAWTMTYELGLRSTIDEDVRATRFFAALAGKDFLNALGQRNAAAADVLRSELPWMAEVKELRDPAAHRLPLRFAPGVILDEDKPEFERLQAEAMAALERGDLDEHRRLRHEQRRVARFIPFLASPPPDTRGLRIVPNLINQDQERFLAIATYVIEHVIPRSHSAESREARS
jgi:hypothetical protein